MGLFDKKYCSVCGEKIGLLGNRKLENGNLCKDCARKLSPFFNDRRNSTVEEIKQQLAYREENERQLANFSPDSVFGDYKKVYVDIASAKFIVTSASNWRNANPDIISLSQVTGVNTNIKENKTEIFYQDDEGKRQSYNPQRYTCEYEFKVTILINSPWFDKIELELSSDNRPDSPYTDLYRHYEKQMNTLSNILNGLSSNSSQDIIRFANPKTREDAIIADCIKNSTWTCKTCNFINPGTFTCRNCGALISDEKVLDCAKVIAHTTLMTEESSIVKDSNAILQNDSHKWICSFCGSHNSGNFCENCGARKANL